MDVELRIETRSPSTTTLLAGAWVYRLVGSNVTAFRTSSVGKLLQLRAGGNAARPWEYTERFVIATGTQLNLYFSRGQTAIPAAILSALPSAFEAVTVPPPSAQAAQVSPSGTNTLAVLPESRVTLTDHALAWSAPAELSLLAVTFTTPTDAYHTSGLAQGAALWTNPAGSGALTVTENGAAAAPAAADRPRERAQRLTGIVDAAASAVRVKVLNAAGAAVNLLPNGAATAGVSEVNAVLAAPSGFTRTFEATLLLQDPSTAFGAVQVLAQADGLARPVLEPAFFLLTGVQPTLIDDGEPAPRARGEADEVIIVDFDVSPQPDRPSISAQTRARRMVRYQLRGRARAFNSVDTASPTATVVTVPEMPQWMVELQLFGVTRPALEELLQRRKHGLPGGPTALDITFTSTLGLAWDGPNSGAATRPYRYQQSFAENVSVHFELDATEQLAGVSAAGVATNARVPAPTAIPFPVAGRRLPQVELGAQRNWGRQAGAPGARAAIIEVQPRVVNSAGRELVRGGDGTLRLSALTIAGQPHQPGLDPDGAAFTTPATSDAVLPKFRVTGTTPPAATVNALIDVAVTDFFNRNATLPHVALLALAVWQDTLRRIILHESAGRLAQFETRGAGRRAFGGQLFGHENDMPMFGAPAGYGLGQLDNPAVNDDEAWSFFENVRKAVRIAMQDKALPAFNSVQPHLSTPPTRRQLAVFRRDVVRRYNGGTEFRFQGGDFEIFPRQTNAARLGYPNTVLGTAVVYAGVSVAVAFTAADFGPGI